MISVKRVFEACFCAARHRYAGQANLAAVSLPRTLSVLILALSRSFKRGNDLRFSSGNHPFLFPSNRETNPVGPSELSAGDRCTRASFYYTFLIKRTYLRSVLWLIPVTGRKRSRKLPD